MEVDRQRGRLFKNSLLPWVVPYSDLKRQSAQSIISPPLQLLPMVQDLQVTLYLLGIGKGRGSHLSLGFSDSGPKKGANLKMAESYYFYVTVINQEDCAESIKKSLILDTYQEDGGPSIPKLIPISSVEDTSLGFLSDGKLLINICIDDILV